MGIDLGLGASVQVPTSLDRATTKLLFAAVCEASPAILDTVTGHFRCAGGLPAEEAFRRIVVRAEGELNEPPSILRWELVRADAIVRPDAMGDIALPRCESEPCGAWVVRVVPIEGAAETTGSQDEALVASFYATAGELDPPRDAAAPGEVRPMTSRWVVAEGVGYMQLGVVLRDQRGGESVRVGRVLWR